MPENKKQLILFLLNSVFGAWLIYFLVSTFLLRVFYSLSFFLFAFFVQSYILSDSTFNFRLSKALVYSLKAKNVLTSIYVWGILASTIVVLIPSYPFPIYSEGIYLSFLSLSPILLLRVILGYFLVAFFPGKVVYDFIFRSHYKFDRFEQLGFALVVSYIFSTILGLILLRLTDLITPLSFVASVWFFILLVAGYKLFKGEFAKEVEEDRDEAYVRVNWAKWGILLLMIAILLFSSYLVHMFSLQFSGIYSGDLQFYLTVANEFVNFGKTFSPYLWFQVYMKVCSFVTGLPPLYSLAGLQFFVLLPPVAFYTFMKTLFPQFKKAPAITAAFVFLQGFTALPIAIAMVGSETLYNEYMSGNVLSVLSSYGGGIGAVQPCWISVFTSLIDAALGVLTFTFVYRYFVGGEKERNLDNLFLGALFFLAAFFTHGIFFLGLFFVVLTLYLIVQNTQGGYKKFLFFIGLVTVMLLPLEFLNKWHFLYTGHQTTRYLFTHYWPFLPIIVLPIYFKEKISAKIRPSIRLSARIEPEVLEKALFWVSAVTIFSVSLVLATLNWNAPFNAIRISSFPPLFPWYVYVLCYGLPLLIVIGMLPSLLRTIPNKPLKFVLCWFSSALFLGLIGSYLLTMTLPTLLQASASLLNRYVMQIVYLTSGLGALVLDNFNLLNLKATVAFRPSIFRRFKRFKISLRNILLTTFIFALAVSFLDIPYVTELYYKTGNQPSALETRVTSLEAEAFTWINLKVPEGSTILSLSESSYLKLCSLTRSKILPPESINPIFSSLFELRENVIVSDDQTAFWEVTQPSFVAASDDVEVVDNGNNSYKIIAGPGRTAYRLFEHRFAMGNELNLSGAEFISIDFYGSGSMLRFTFFLSNEPEPPLKNYLVWEFFDNFEGWRTMRFSLNFPDGSGGKCDILSIRSIEVMEETLGEGIWYFDCLSTGWIEINQTRFNQLFESYDVSYVYFDSSTYYFWLRYTSPITPTEKMNYSKLVTFISSTFHPVFENNETKIYMA